MANLLRHIENVRKFGVPVTVAINHFTADTEAETDVIAEGCRQVGVHAHLCRHWADGGKGAQDLAETSSSSPIPEPAISSRSIRPR